LQLGKLGTLVFFPFLLHQLVEVILANANVIIQKNFTLTLLEPPGFGDFRKKNSSFWLAYQRPSSSAPCARELFSGSNGSASVVDCTRKKIFAD